MASRKNKAGYYVNSLNVNELTNHYDIVVIHDCPFEMQAKA